MFRRPDGSVSTAPNRIGCPLKDLGFPVLRDVGVTADELETLTDLALDDFFITQAPKPWSRNEVLTAFQNAYALTSR